jgi:pimeloyl-ACP methyl ester carboxylesterase
LLQQILEQVPGKTYFRRERSRARLYPQLEDLDFIKQAPKLEVPVYLFVGRYDVNAMYTIVEEYYSVLKAPHKELIWLEGGHGLGGDNVHQFVDVMLNKVLVETSPTND